MKWLNTHSQWEGRKKKCLRCIVTLIRFYLQFGKKGNWLEQCFPPFLYFVSSISWPPVNLEEKAWSGIIESSGGLLPHLFWLNPTEDYICCMFWSVLWTNHRCLTSPTAVQCGRRAPYYKTSRSPLQFSNGCLWLREGRWTSEMHNWNRVTLTKKTVILSCPDSLLLGLWLIQHYWRHSDLEKETKISTNSV